MIAQVAAAVVLLHAPLMDTPYFGTKEFVGTYGQGSVVRMEKKETTTIYSFCPANGCGDGAHPVGNVVELPDGSIVGTTSEGGSGAGTIFQLRPTTSGWTYIHIWNVCWVYQQCGYYGTPRGTLQYLGPDKDNNFVLEGMCESIKGRGVTYQLTIIPNDNFDQHIVPVKYW